VRSSFPVFLPFIRSRCPSFLETPNFNLLMTCFFSGYMMERDYSEFERRMLIFLRARSLLVPLSPFGLNPWSKCDSADRIPFLLNAHSLQGGTFYAERVSDMMICYFRLLACVLFLSSMRVDALLSDPFLDRE